jgi:acyl carrier protein
MITERLKKVLLTELRLDDYRFEDSTKAFEVPGWDSLSHVAILSAVEKEFNVRLKTLEVLRLSSVGDLQRLVDHKIAR